VAAIFSKDKRKEIRHPAQARQVLDKFVRTLFWRNEPVWQSHWLLRLPRFGGGCSNRMSQLVPTYRESYRDVVLRDPSTEFIVSLSNCSG